MSEDRSSNGHKSWLDKITQAFAHEPKTARSYSSCCAMPRQQAAGQRGAVHRRGAIQVADLQVRDIMVPRSQMMSIRSTQTPKEFLPAIIEAAHSRYPVVGESLDDVMGVLLAKDLLPLILHNDERPFDIKGTAASGHLRPRIQAPQRAAPRIPRQPQPHYGHRHRRIRRRGRPGDHRGRAGTDRR